MTEERADFDHSIEEQEHGLNRNSKLDGEKQKQQLSVKSIDYQKEEDDSEIEEERDMRRYCEQIKASDGYDVDDFPRLKAVYYGLHVPLSNPNDDDGIRELAKFAIHEYNKKNIIKYDLEKVLKANTTSCGIASFYITFVARDEDGGSETFQAEVFEGMDDEFGNPDREVVDFRIKPKRQSKVAEESAVESA